MSPGKRFVRPQAAQCAEEDPNADDDCGCRAAYRSVASHCCLRPRSAFGQYSLRNQFNRYDNAERNQNQVVQIAQNRHKIRYQVDRTERICDDAGDEDLRVPRRLWMTRGKV